MELINGFSKTEIKELSNEPKLQIKINKDTVKNRFKYHI